MFEVIISTQVKKDLKKIFSTPYYKKVKKALLEMQNNPFVGDVKSLKSFPFAQYRKRIGPYRILFDIMLNEREIFVYRIRHRKEAYRL